MIKCAVNYTVFTGLELNRVYLQIKLFIALFGKAFKYQLLILEFVITTD